MNTKLLMTASSILLLAAGVTLTFAPQEAASLFSTPTFSVLPLIMQMLGALYFGFGMVNWLAKESLLGGIYGRPIVVGNLAHFTIGALALMKGASTAPEYGAAIVYALFAAAFGVTMYTQPKTQ
jgi:Fe2+ transport system protein B